MKTKLLCLLVMFTSTALAQKLKTVEGEYTYYAPENVTLEQARNIALDRAKIQALANAFGTIVSQYNTTRTENSKENSSVDFTSIGGSEVKGEWIETIGSPIYSIRYEGDMLVVSVKVKGKAREIITVSLDLKVHVLKNGTEDKFESDQFRSGDDLYLSFSSPVAGYLAVYLVDADQQAFCLLPYRSQQTGIYPIEANRRYVFFSSKETSPKERSFVDEYTMTCERFSETNYIYVIFSPNQFTKAVDTESGDYIPRKLSNTYFQQWLAKCRKQDNELRLQIITMIIEK